MTRLLRGDEAAFDRFVSEYYPRLYRFAHRRLGGKAESALDVVQTTFQKVVPRLDSWRGEASLFSWMCGFCRFEIAAVWKGEGPEIADDDPAVRAALDSLPALDGNPATDYEHKELGRAVRTALDHLPRHYVNALEWKYLCGLSVQEIATRLAMTSKAVESLLTRARQAFRDAFTELEGRKS
ncbi:MAG: sigma-70 family RNA polymerase sigma factor [Acidobacteriota bacterium]